MAYLIESGPIETKDNIKKILEGDRDKFRKNFDKNGLYATGILLGEIERDPKKDYSDKNVTKILRLLRKATVKMYDNTPDDPDNPNKDFFIIQMIDTYIPAPISDMDVSNWLEEFYPDFIIGEMGKSAYRIIGEAKKFFDGREINTDVIKDKIDSVLEKQTIGVLNG